MSQVREALKREFGRNKAGLLERIKEHPLLRDEDYALILSYEDRPAKITVDKLIDLYLSYPTVNSPQSNSPKSTTRKARNASNTETHIRDHLQMLPMEDIQAIAKELRLPIDNFHESQRSRVISLIIGKLVHRHSSVSGHNALSNAKASKVMRKIDSRYKEVYKTYMNAPTRKNSKVSVVKFHNS